MKLSDYVFQCVAEAGVRHVFLLAGGGCMHLLDSIGRRNDIEYVCNLHEQACAIAAEAYGQYTNNLGVALVTTGPGGTNTLTGVTAAWLDSTPCLFISGQVKRPDMIGNRGVRQMGFQEINIVDIVRPVTKYAVTVTDPDAIRYEFEKAVFLAQSGRPGPVWLDIPLDVQSAQVEEAGLAGFTPEESAQKNDADRLSEQVGRAIEMLNASERPVVLVGNGVRLARALDDFLRLVESLRIPVLTTWKTIDFLPENHPLFMGRPGATGQRGANFTQQNSDWILTVGARLDLGQTGYSHANFARAARKVIVDIDSAEIAKLDMRIDVAICADAKAFLGEMLRRRTDIAARDRSSWLRRCGEWKARYPVCLPEYRDEKDGVNNYALVDALSDAMSAPDVLAPACSGASSEATMQAFRVKQGMRVLNAQGLGSMGFGVPAAIGACLASGRKRTVCIEGDGGFHMNTQELETVRRLNLPIKFFVLNNNGYASIRATQRNYFDGRFTGSSEAGGQTLPDTLKVASAYGLATAEIRDHSDIRKRVRRVLDHEGPIVCDVRISPNQRTAPRISSVQRADGSIVSSPLEDLWPFLDRAEFRENMLIPVIDDA